MSLTGFLGSSEAQFLETPMRNGRSETSADVGEYIELRRSNLRGRRPVRADRRLRTDEKYIRAQPTILYKSHPKPPLLLSLARPLAATKMTKTFARMRQSLRSNCITVFLVRMRLLSSRTKNAVGSRSAQIR